MRPAEALFDAQIAAMKAESDVIDVLDRVFGDDWDDMTYDYYDRSIEVLGVKNLDADLAPLWEAGFQQAWLHPGSAKVREVERFFRAPVGKTLGKNEDGPEAATPEPSRNTDE